MSDSSVSMILAQRSWQAASGFVTTLLIAVFLSPVQQGWYYSFLSVAALYTLFDLGLSVVLVQFAARLFVDLRWSSPGPVEGANESRFIALLTRSARLYLLLAVLFATLVLPGGLLFFGAKDSALPLSGESWIAPWAVLVLATAIGIFVLPYFAVIEGSGRVREVYAVRLAQGIAGSAACWAVLLAGGGLWATVALPGIGVVVAFAWLLVQRRGVLQAAWRRVQGSLEWRREVWPLQWRVGLVWLSGYLLTQIYTPILFHFQGAVVAGQMGLSLSIANMLGILAQSWIAQKVPAMTQAAQKRDWTALDRLFGRNFAVSVVAFVAGAMILGVLRILLKYTAYNVRVLAFWPFVGLLVVALVGHTVGALATQLRSFGREPLVWVNATVVFLTAPFSIWAAAAYAAPGVVAAVLCVQLFLMLPASIFVWRTCNRRWREAA